MELPQYKLKLAAGRIAIPKALRVLVLAPFIVFAIWLNLFVLAIETPSWLWLFLIVASILFAVIEFLLYYNRFSKYEYWFFLDRVEYHNKLSKVFYFSQYQVSVIKQGFLDKLLNTGTINLSNNFAIGPIKKTSEVSQYLANLISYSRRL